MPAHPAFSANLPDLASYLEAHQEIVHAREGFFFALRTYLQPSQRGDAKDLSDPWWNSPAREIQDKDWIANASRGYLTIRENLASGRPFRVSTLQLGHILKTGVRLPQTVVVTQPSIVARISGTFPEKAPTQLRLSTGEVLFDWSFAVPDLYQSALSMEAAVYLVGTLFENSLQAILGLAK